MPWKQAVFFLPVYKTTYRGSLLLADMASPANPPNAPAGTLTQAQLDELTNLVKKSLSGDDLYRNLQEFEAKVVPSFHQSRRDPVAIRCQLPKSILNFLVSLLPKDKFYPPDKGVRHKVDEASKIWGIESTMLLFQVGWDYARQSKPVFHTATQIAKIESSWDRCLSLLVEQTATRRKRIAESGNTTQFCPRGISNNDFQTIHLTLVAEQARQNRDATRTLTPSDGDSQIYNTTFSSRSPTMDRTQPKRQKMEDEHSLFHPQNETERSSPHINSWVEELHLNKALVKIADAVPEVFAVDSESADAVGKADYKPNRRIAAGVANSNKLLVVINVKDKDKTHRVLAVVEHESLAARNVILMDSLPKDETLAVAQLRIDCFIKWYLPNTGTRQRRIVSQLSRRQRRDSDCVIFVLVFAVFAMTDQALPERIDIGLWRDILAAISYAQDLEISGTKGSDLINDMPGQNGISRELESLDAWNGAVSSCGQVLRALKSTAAQELTYICQQLDIAVYLEGMEIDEDDEGPRRDHEPE